MAFSISTNLPGGLVLAFTFFISLSLAADDVRFEELPLDQGISHNLVYCIEQDQTGYLWLGTMYGLVKYDGRHFESFRHDPEVANSLSFDDIISLFLDSAGHLWIGTWGGGLNHLDPASGEITRFLHDPLDSASISDPTIWSITETIEADERSIWLATERGGLNRIRLPLTNVHQGQLTDAPIDVFRHETENPASLPSDALRTLFVDSGNELWIGSWAGLIRARRPDAGSIVFTTYRHSDDDPHSIATNAIVDITEDRAGNMWIGTSNAGIARIDAADRDRMYVAEHFRHDPSDPASLISDQINFVREDSQARLWVGTNNGLSRKRLGVRKFENYQADPASKESLSSDNVIAFCEDKAGIIWLGTYYGGVNKFAPHKSKFERIGRSVPGQPSLRGSRVASVIEDRNGNLWAGTLDAGICLLLPVASKEGSGRYANIDPGAEAVLNDLLPSSKISALHETVRPGKRQLWIGTTDNGLLAITNPESLDDLLAQPPATQLRRMRELKTQHYPGNRADSSALSSNAISAIYQDKSGRLWVGTWRGLNRIDLSDGSITRYLASAGNIQSLPHNWILMINEDAAGNIWVGSYGGLSRYDDQLDCFESFQHSLDHKESLSNNYVYAVHEDRQGRFWVGTSNGLNLFERGQRRFHKLDEGDGLANSVIGAILEDHRGNLWVSTQRGISRIGLPLNVPGMDGIRQLEVHNFDISDGLQSNIFYPGAAAKTRTGAMLFGSVNGLNIGRPADMRFNTHRPPVVIKNVLLRNKPIEPVSRLPQADSQQLDLHYTENFLTIQFAALDFAAPEKNRFQYRLTGVDPQWIDAKNAVQASYTGLAPGHYLFQVKGANNDGLWSESTADLKFVIHPPFWLTSWFYILLIALVGGILYLAHRWQLKFKLRQLLLLETARTEEREMMREQTARDYHDELGHQLTKISLYSELLKREIGENDAGGPIRDHLKKITAASTNLTNDTRNFIWTLDPGKDSMMEMILHITDFGKSLFEDTAIDFFADEPDKSFEDIRLPMDSRRHITLIFKEALNNIAKHSSSKEVYFMVSMSGDTVEIMVKDDGGGMDLARLKPGNGIRNMQRRAEKVDGIVRIESKPGMGTTIRFSGPLTAIKTNQ